MSRPLKHSPKKIRAAYQHFKSSLKAAKKLGISHTTVLKYAKQLGLSTRDRGDKVDKEHKPKHWSKFIEWVKEHEDVVLPRSVSKVAEMSGLSKDTIKSYLYRRKEHVLEQVKKIDVRNFSYNFRAVEGMVFSMYIADGYEYEVDQFSLKITIKGKMLPTKHHGEIVKNKPFTIKNLDHRWFLENFKE